MKYKKFAGFVMAGGAATLLNYLVFLGLLALNAQYLLASAIGFTSGIVVSFTLNRLFVFKKAEGAHASFGIYTAVYTVALVAQLVLLQILVQNGIHPASANILAILSLIVINYFVVRKLVFRS
jgi:putative flippase GtrA